MGGVIQQTPSSQIRIKYFNEEETFRTVTFTPQESLIYHLSQKVEQLSWEEAEPSVKSGFNLLDYKVILSSSEKETFFFLYKFAPSLKERKEIELDLSSEIELDLSSDIVKEINKKVKKGDLLSLEDIKKINRKLEEMGDQSTLQEILDLLEKEIEMRNEEFNVNCVEELYRGNELLPQNLRTPRPKSNNLKSLVNEKIRAILLNEYRNFHRTTNRDFEEGKITYDEFIERTRRYAKNVNKEYSSD